MNPIEFFEKNPINEIIDHIDFITQTSLHHCKEPNDLGPVIYQRSADLRDFLRFMEQQANEEKPLSNRPINADQ